MPSPAQTLVTSAFALSQGLAQQVIVNSGSCPFNQISYTDQTGSYCCPGSIFSEGDNPFCCVAADFQVAQPTFANCFPFCGSSTDDGLGISSTTTQACSTSIFLSDSNYSSLAQAAATSLSSNGGSTSSTTASASASSSGGSRGGGNSGHSSSTANASGQGSSSSSSKASAAGAMITSGPLAGAVMVAGGLVMAL